MPVERLREHLMPNAQTFFALGRDQPPPKFQPKGNNPRPEVISVGSTVSTSSTATTPSASSTSGPSIRKPSRMTRPIVYSSDESDEEESDYEEARETLNDGDDDGEIEILSNAPSPQPRSPSQKTDLTQPSTQLPNLAAPSQPLPPSNGTNRPRSALVGTQALYKPDPALQGSFPTPIHIPSNKGLPTSGPLMRPATFDYDHARVAQPHAQVRQFRQDEPQQSRLPLPNPQFNMNTTGSQGSAEENMTAAETEKALRDLISGEINDDGEADIDTEDKIVEGFKEGIKLLDHQVIGRNWMAGRERPEEKKYGGILADDMGLGKTIQTLTRIVDNPASKADRDEGWSPSTLVVCPLGLVGQWADEIKKMTKLSVVKHQGTSRTTDPHFLRKHNVVVTTYDTVKSEYAAFNPVAKDESRKTQSNKNLTESDHGSDEAEHFGRTVKKPAMTVTKRKSKNALYQVKWFRIVLDEAHNIKNHNTKGAIACSELKGRFKWCLTGTPLQNNVTELYSLLKFLNIRPWSHYDKFNSDIGQPIKTGRGASTAMKRLQYILKQIMLRRRKDDTLNGRKLIDLPKRNVQIMSCPFDASERAFYTSLESKMDETLEKLMKSDKGNKYISVLLLLLRLRQACNHPLLVTKDYKKDLEAVDSQVSKENSSVDADDLVAAFGQMGVSRKCQMCTMELTPKNVGEGRWSGHCITCIPLAETAALVEHELPTSAKIRMVLKILNDIDEKSNGEEKTIIFSQFTSMLDLIMPFLKEKGIRFTRYDGSMTPADREAALTKIKDKANVRVILISFKAGSTGLNLTACNNVILVDLWWNPALEDQAFDRAHRFGQTRDVNIYKLKIDETVEERILLLQDRKRMLAQAALSGDKLKNVKLGMDDLLALFRHNTRDDSDSDEERSW